jgi:subtilisin-like proprotein convertase family protein
MKLGWLVSLAAFGVLASSPSPAAAGTQRADQAGLKRASPTPGPMSVRSPEGRAALASQLQRMGQPDVPLAWTPAASLPPGAGVVRYAHTQCDAVPGSFFVISGVDEAFAVTTNAWRYDATTNTWNPLAPFPSAVEGPAAVCDGNFVYVLGGGGTTQFFIYDVANNTWAPGAALPRGMWGAALGAFNGQIFMIGGDNDFTFGGTSNQVNIYDIASNTWVGTGANMPAATVTSGWTQVGSDVYIAGGWTDSSPGANSTLTQRYDMAGDTWTAGPAFTSGRADLSLSATSLALYAAGGDANGGGAFDPTNLVESLDYSTFPAGAWTNIGDPIPTALTAINGGFCTNVVSGGEVWTVGGFTGAVIQGTTQFRTSEPCPSAGPPAPLIVTAGSALTSEGCGPANGAIDPDEVVTVDFSLRNAGTADTVDLVASLQASGGVTPITTSQDYGVLVAGGATVTRSFSFAAAGACGGSITASLDLQDGATGLGTKTYTFPLGVLNTNSFSNPAPITINDNTTAAPYPSNIAVSGLSPSVYKVTATITGFNHTFPADVDILLVGPAGQSVLLEGGAGGGTDVVNVNLTYDDAGPPIPGVIVSGTYHPTDVFHTPLQPPAPAEPYGGALAVFNGTDPNGTWSLYVHDHAGVDIGNISGGWSLTFSEPACCVGPAGEISIGDSTVAEGDVGNTDAVFQLSLSAPSGSPVSVDFDTVDGTATTADNDYLPLSGTAVFNPGETNTTITITVVGDTVFEADETYFVTLSNAVGATIGDGQGLGTILNDDKPLAADTSGELIHDSRETRDLDTISRFWRISQKAHSSYEVVVDALTGDLGSSGPELLRVGSDGTTVLQTALSATGGSSKSLRFENTAAAANDAEFIRVHSLGCVSDCDLNDTFRVRAYDTTYRISRVNNSATQVTVIVIANPTDEVVTGTLWFYQSGGTLLASQAVSINPKATFVLNTSTLAPLVGQAGAATFSNDAPYGALAGKGVAVEPATGFTFDTAMVPRPAATKMIPRDN